MFKTKNLSERLKKIKKLSQYDKKWTIDKIQHYIPRTNLILLHPNYNKQNPTHLGLDEFLQRQGQAAGGRCGLSMEQLRLQRLLPAGQRVRVLAQRRMDQLQFPFHVHVGHAVGAVQWAGGEHHVPALLLLDQDHPGKDKGGQGDIWK